MKIEKSEIKQTDKYFFLIIFTLAWVFTPCLSFATAPKGLNLQFIGVWSGSAFTKGICTHKNQNKDGRSKIKIEIKKPLILPGRKYTIDLVSDWGCFSEMKIPGFIFDNEFWGGTNDRMTFVKLTLNKNDTISGKFRFDLNGDSLKIDFEGFKRGSPKQTTLEFSPVEFLEYLHENCCEMVTLMQMPEGWIKKEDVVRLKKYIGDTRKSSPVYSLISSHTCGRSTVEREALYLIKGFQVKRYPPNLCSTYDFDPKTVKLDKNE